jgi:hypothetical protein
MAAPHVFLSYSRSDLEDARILHAGLKAGQVVVWWDQEQVPGTDWLEQLLDWLEAADAIVVLVSRHSVISPSVKNEILLAQDFGRRVVPVLREQARGGLWVLIRALQWVDARGGRDPVPELLAALHGTHCPTADAPDANRDAMNVPMSELSPPAASAVRAQVTIVLPGSLATFDAREQLSLVQLLARFTRLRPEEIRIVRVEAGSIHVTLELPESSARWLVAAFETRAPIVGLLDIVAVRDLRVLAAPAQSIGTPPSTAQAGNRRRGWPGWGALALAGTLAVTLLLVAMSTLLRGPQLPGANPVGIIAGVKGSLELRRVSWNAFVPVSDGTQLRAGDELRLAPGGQATIVCADEGTVELQDGTQQVPCASDGNLLLFDVAQTAWANAVLGPEPDAVPQVIAPRATYLLTTTPTIRWTAVDGAGAYTVYLQREGEELWRERLAGATALTYPAGQAPLEPGPVYRFIVTAEGGAEEVAQGIGVQVLDPQQARDVRATAERLQNLGLDLQGEQLLLANLYAQRGLYAEALDLLEAPTDAPAPAAAFLLQSDILLAIGLPNLAVTSYTQALDGAAQAGDRPGQARANRMLGVAYSRLGGPDNRTRAMQHLEQALQFYEEIGDDNARKELRQLLQDLS